MLRWRHSVARAGYIVALSSLVSWFIRVRYSGVAFVLHQEVPHFHRPHLLGFVSWLLLLSLSRRRTTWDGLPICPLPPSIRCSSLILRRVSGPWSPHSERKTEATMRARPNGLTMRCSERRPHPTTRVSSGFIGHLHHAPAFSPGPPSLSLGR